MGHKAGAGTRSLSVSQARRLTLASQGFLDTPDRRGVNRRDLRRMMGRIKLLQLDSVPVVIRTQYLPAFSRLGPYRPKLLDEMAYKHDEMFEAWAHEASVMPVSHEPLLRWHKEQCRAGQTWKGLVAFAGKESKFVEEVLAQVRERGPLLASELADPRPGFTGGWGTKTSGGSIALDWLYRIGEVSIRRTGNFEKQYDVIDRIVPAEVLATPTPHRTDALKELLVLSAEAFGVGTAADLVDYFRLPKRDSKPLIEELAEDGRLIRATVKGWDKPVFMTPDAKIPRRTPRRALLSPFDPVVWYRDRGERLFDFFYRIEIYTPAKKRVFGYYVLPFLMGERIVGRVDVKTDRKAGVLQVPAVWIEDHADPKSVAPELAGALLELSQFVGVDQVKVGRKGNLADGLRKEMQRRGKAPA